MPLSAPPPPASPWQRFYAAVLGRRARHYDRHARSLPRPVVSIGNLGWGGGGKTPLTAAVAAHLRDRGHDVCILSRGYGRRGGEIRLVSRGSGPLLSPEEAGDEPFLLAEQLAGVAIVVGADRFAAGMAARERVDPAPSLYLLDDGFSHLALRRDLDLVAFPAAAPFAGGRLLPSGRLREPLAAMARAHAAILTGAAGRGEGDELAAALGPFGFTGPGFASFTRPEPPRLADGSPLPAGGTVLLASAIARPASFEATVRGLGFEVAGHLRFPDHHPYPEESRQKIAAAWQALRATAGRAGMPAPAALLVTGKDRVKLTGRLPPEIPLAELPIRAEPVDAFWDWLDTRKIVRPRPGPSCRWG